jgi:hypothetical protein
VNIQREKEQLLVERATIKEEFNKECNSVLVLAQEEQELVEVQVVNLAETI